MLPKVNADVIGLRTSPIIHISILSRSKSLTMLISNPTTASASHTHDTAIRPTVFSDEQPSTCTICLEHLHVSTPPTSLLLPNAPVPEPAVTIKRCGHVFGRNCLEHWMRDSNTCPICRIEFFNTPRTCRTTEEDAELHEDSGDRGLYAMRVYIDQDMMARFEQMGVGDEGEGGR
jgi:hypothetical protein